MSGIKNKNMELLYERLAKLEKENEMLTSEVSLYKDLFLEALDGIVLWDANGTIKVANNAACRIFECSHSELLTRKIDDFVLSKDQQYLRMKKKLCETGSIREELLFLMPNGQKKLLEFTSKLNVEDGFHLTIFRNVSERYRMEKKLRENEQKFRKIFEGAFEGIILWNDRHEIVDVNQLGCKMLEFSKEEIIGHSLVDMLAECNVSQDDINDNLAGFRQRGEMNGTVAITVKSGKRKHFEFSGKTNFIAGLNLTVFRDITEKLEMEEQLRKSDTLNVVGELAAGIAHEIRNPMTAIKGFIQLLQGSIKEDHSMYFHVITTELKRIDSIINEFLILAKPQSVKFVKTDICQIMKETVELLSAQAVLHNVQFRTYYEEHLPQIYCEPIQLKKVFINMIKNAIEVMPKGGFITISIEKTAHQSIHISIHDQGIGIPQDKLKKLGEPFYTTKERGTGLGLMVSYKIIEEHQGSIEVESQIGEGTVFHIYLPLNKGREI